MSRLVLLALALASVARAEVACKTVCTSNLLGIIRCVTVCPAVTPAPDDFNGSLLDLSPARPMPRPRLPLGD
jgi:hypothetical protein